MSLRNQNKKCCYETQSASNLFFSEPQITITLTSIVLHLFFLQGSTKCLCWNAYYSHMLQATTQIMTYPSAVRGLQWSPVSLSTTIKLNQFHNPDLCREITSILRQQNPVSTDDHWLDQNACHHSLPRPPPPSLYEQHRCRSVDKNCTIDKLSNTWADTLLVAFTPRKRDQAKRWKSLQETETNTRKTTISGKAKGNRLSSWFYYCVKILTVMMT